MSAYVVGQRFVSESEPELGLGVLERVERRRIAVRFPASDTLRLYAESSAPIRRVRFRVGDEVEDARGHRLRIEEVEESEGLVYYREGARRVAETELSGRLDFSKPEDRLLARLWSPSAVFDLRREALEHLHQWSRSPARGFLGARIELIPHQLYIAREIASRARPRALLADEVGLGKTIEAGLVLHRLLRTGQIARVLILVPESLVHQWFVEMFRRFHLSFTVVDEAFFEGSGEDPGSNPFLQVQAAIASLDLLVNHPTRAQSAVDAGWDMLVVDEAHHLAWSEEDPSPGYRLVEAIASRSDGVLLLTATPEQLGGASHFARLRLLDPERYSSYPRYLEERRGYRAVASAVAGLLDGGAPTRADSDALRSLLPPNAASLRRSLRRFLDGDERERAELVAALVDQHGPGRVVFRNTRKVLDSFPERRVAGWKLEWPEDADGQYERLTRELLLDVHDGQEGEAWSCSYDSDARTLWLLSLLRDIAPDKALVICRTRRKAIALHGALQKASNLPLALFHEDLSLLQRDRNAAWFADARNGARALLCSEIGSEGRNFQFAHHLVLFDLPWSPELLEQRIGRLYRIGQEHPVTIHVPYLPGTPQETQFLWFHEGLGAFEESLPDASAFTALSEEGRELALSHLETRASGRTAALREWIERTRRFREEVARELEGGRDRLLELSSFRPAEADSLVAEARRWDEDRGLDRFVVRALDYLGVELEEVALRTFVLRQGNQLVVDALPGLRAEEVGMTSDRNKATHQGELDLLSWDHPMVSGVLDVLLGGEHGTAAVAMLPAGRRRPGALLEALFVLEAVAPPVLQVSRFLPPTPMRVVLDERCDDATGSCPSAELEARLVDGRTAFRYRDLESLAERLPRMLSRARELVEERASEEIARGLSAMTASLSGEVERLRALMEVNDHVHPEEVRGVEASRDRIAGAIRGARVRLDALRWIAVGESGEGS
jgi:ATP-dependent helicase HepA